MAHGGKILVLNLRVTDFAASLISPCLTCHLVLMRKEITILVYFPTAVIKCPGKGNFGEEGFILLAVPGYSQSIVCREVLGAGP